MYLQRYLPAKRIEQWKKATEQNYLYLVQSMKDALKVLLIVYTLFVVVGWGGHSQSVVRAWGDSEYVCCGWEDSPYHCKYTINNM